MHPLLAIESSQSILLLGNEAIARGALEAGVAFATAYPGTPSSEIALQFFQISRESDLYFEYSANEKVALEMAAGAAMCGLRAMTSMKHVGLNVAADALMTLAYTGVNGALVLVVADDPFMFSSQNEQDTRWYGKLSGLPILEPSTVAEAKEMTLSAFDLSESLKLPVLLRTTTRINHASGMVTMGPLRERIVKGAFEKDPMSYVCIPAVSRELHPKLLDKMGRAAAMADESPWNRIEGDGRWGIVCNGVSYGYVSDAIHELGAADRFKVLRVGFSHPFPEILTHWFLEGCEKVLVAEEGEPYLQEAVRNCAHRNGMMLPIHGKGEGLFSRLYEFDPTTVKRVISSYFHLPFTASASIRTDDLPEVPARPPNLCPGCPHRAAYAAVREVFGDEAIYPTDIGCYTLGLLPPLRMGDFLIAMGAGIGTAGGFARATGRKVVAFIGDSTFFHSGLSPLASAVYNNHDFMVVILDNGTTGMTGHQPHPGVDLRHLNLERAPVSIEAAVKGLGVENLLTVNPFKYRKTVAAVRELARHPGVSVLIARAPCPLYERTLPHYRKRRPFRVNAAKCRGHKVCLSKLACPAFFAAEGQVGIDPDRCTGCALCAQLCPENAIMPARDKEAAR
ncbi:indolepyruvate ferredoxin oxidoreductase subunit alpha [Desulfatitalea alkaliphila]|uniref:Indolepyruvate oxidoreductase subunit IorA n=1 Tax=Desulfatitalea alkaliphila TaxID=2929485 RepID=A0AA41UMI4_9BACT|nr:indolepyruvate ferredoxin oxidoreductase subunit alpha [Desulfatitalea alkaliphila]MCJ8502636.1 indolepyruvate ferredoxin oxidoreductase subunit alpha [Desulfatitalea alkaliphila]